MRVNSRTNREEQVKVVIRLKPQSPQQRPSKCVSLSETNQNQLVVSTLNKKQIFMFDSVASQNTSQQELYRMLGQQCVQQTFQGYNCCIFAYGQTGAGKTYSVLGNLQDLLADPYSTSRGILPRTLQDLFQCQTMISSPSDSKLTLKCSYIQIYNEQIFDLLSPDKRLHMIREDAKKGVFVQGLIQKEITSYKQVLDLLINGQRIRTTATTLMNNQSSRSHAIFTIKIQHIFVEQETVKNKRAKLHVVDLAGSQRVKHTNVEGSRLRQGCNINRSLHVLGNVINSLVQSAKKKKHVPYRDSKLTHYLKDSLGGNSITKLLANIHTNKIYFGDTLSTLMFAKRAKNLKTKAQLNQTSTDNFDTLRKEVRRLREELAQARYFKSETPVNNTPEPQFQTQQKIYITDHTQGEYTPRMDALRVLQDNEIHYKALIQIYEQHMKSCTSSSHLQRKQNINIVKQWKNLQRRNISLTQLVKQMPAWSKIYREYLLLKENNSKQIYKKLDLLQQSQQKITQKVKFQQINMISQNVGVSFENIQKIIKYYQNILSEIQQKFKGCLQTLQKNYSQLQTQCRNKDKKIKQLRKKRDYPLDMAELINNNQYLQLSILQLEEEIAQASQRQQKLTLQLKEERKISRRQGKQKQQKKDKQKSELQSQDPMQISIIYQKILQIQQQAAKQAQIYQQQRKTLYQTIQNLQNQLNKFLKEHHRLKVKYYKSKSRSRHHRSQSQKKINKQNNLATSHATNLLHTNSNQTPTSQQILLATHDAPSLYECSVVIEQPSVQPSVKQFLVVKMQLKRKQKEIIDLKKDVGQFMSCDRRIEQEFGKPLQEIIDQYRKMVRSTVIPRVNSYKFIKNKEPQLKQVRSRFELRDVKQPDFTQMRKTQIGSRKSPKRTLNSPIK